MPLKILVISVSLFSIQCLSPYSVCLHTVSVSIQCLSPYSVCLHTVSVSIQCLSPYSVCLHTVSVSIQCLSPYSVCLHTVSVSIQCLSPYSLGTVLLYFSQKTTTTKNEIALVVLMCARYIFWQLFSRRP